MKIHFNLLIKILVFLFVSLAFCFVIGDNKFPDNKVLESQLKENNPILKYTPQNFYLHVNDSIINHKECKFDCKETFDMSSFTRFTFFIPTLILVFLLIGLNFIIDKYELEKDKQISNYIFLTSLCLPSVLLSITGFGPEGSYTLISIFITIRLTLLTKFKLSSLILIILSFLCFLLDKGNFYVFLLFVLGWFFLIKIREYSKPIIFYLIVLNISIIFFLIQNYIFLYLGEILDPIKLGYIIDSLKNLNLNDISINEIIKRNGFFWITLLLPVYADLTFALGAILFLIIYIIILFKQLMTNNILKLNIKNYLSVINNQIIIIWMVLFPVYIISTLPTHAFSKYYLFYVVFLVKPIIEFIGKSKSFFLMAIYSSLSIVESLILEKI